MAQPVGGQRQHLHSSLSIVKLEKDHWGEYITINVDNGDYAVAPEH